MKDLDLLRLGLEALGLLGAGFAWFFGQRLKRAAAEAKREAEERGQKRLEEDRLEKKLEQARRDAWEYQLNTPDQRSPYGWRGGGDE